MRHSERASRGHAGIFPAHPGDFRVASDPAHQRLIGKTAECRDGRALHAHMLRGARAASSSGRAASVVLVPRRKEGPLTPDQLPPWTCDRYLDGTILVSVTHLELADSPRRRSPIQARRRAEPDRAKQRSGRPHMPRTPIAISLPFSPRGARWRVAPPTGSRSPRPLPNQLGRPCSAIVRGIPCSR